MLSFYFTHMLSFQVPTPRKETITLPAKKPIVKKIDRKYYLDKKAGRKDWELRIEDDVQYKVNDLIEYHIVQDGKPTGATAYSIITAVYRDLPGLQPGYCVYSDHIVGERPLSHQN